MCTCSKSPLMPLTSVFGQPTRKLNRYSVLKVLDQMEAEISPCADKNMKGTRSLLASDGGAADINGKKRRKSRVSFGNIQTAIFQKDSEWTSPASSPFIAPGTTGAGRATEFVSHVTNLSTLPDDTVFGSPAGSVAMETTGVVSVPVHISSLPSLPPLSDLSNDGSIASFGDHDGDVGPSAPMSLMDLVADDEHWTDFNNEQPVQRNTFPSRMEFMGTDGGLLVEPEKEPKGKEVDFQPADITNHDLTADIPAPGNRTRAFANHTGAFDVSGAFGGDKSGADQTVACGMELTTAFGGIVHKRSAGINKESSDTTSAMDFTTAYGGIVLANPKKRVQRTSTTKLSLEFSKNSEREYHSTEPGAVQELTEKLERIKSTFAKADEQTEPVAMDMTGTFGRILSAITSANVEDEPVSSPATVTASGTDGTKPSRLLDAFTAQMDEREEARLSPDVPLAARTRSRSGTPSKAGKVSTPQSGGQACKRRRSSRGVSGTRPESITLDTFLEEMGVRFLTNARSNKRKSSVGAYPASQRDEAELSDVDRLRQVSLHRFSSLYPRLDIFAYTNRSVGRFS